MSTGPTSPDWERHRVFLAALDGGSLSAAARTLGLMQPTVRRRVEELERDVGEPLFVRSPSGLTPTALARELAGTARAMASAAAAFDRAASGAAGGEIGQVRIGASEVVGTEVLPRVLAPLLASHPGLVLAVAPNNIMEDILHRQADIAVRMARPTQSALIAKSVGSIPLGLFAHRRLVAARGLPVDLADLRRFPLVGFETETDSDRTIRGRGRPLDAVDFSYRVDSQVAQLAAVRAGLGIGVVQVALARADDLVPVLPDLFRLELPTWIVMHEDQRAVRRIRLVFDHLVTAMTAYAAGAAV